MKTIISRFQNYIFNKQISLKDPCFLLALTALIDLKIQLIMIKMLATSAKFQIQITERPTVILCYKVKFSFEL